jgi:alpha-ribazole phosphatase
MEIYLIRHTKPDVAAGTCYGQTDIGVTASFAAEADAILPHLPGEIIEVCSSPLRRCSQLAEHLFPHHTIAYHADLMEINCGDWEMRRWDDIPRMETDPWMADFVNIPMPGGENYVDIYSRVTTRFEQLAVGPLPLAIVAHGGVIRSILAHITGTALIDSFKAFPLHYGCVARLSGGAGQWRYEMLHNVATEAEQHKPTKAKA